MVAIPALTADLVITSLDRGGNLSWSNSVSNATYRVEWANAVKGPWQSFSILTNLDAIAATNNAMTVKVPMFYRVVWSDPPPPQPEGIYQYKGYDTNGTLVVTGRFSITAQTNVIVGTWTFNQVAPQTNFTIHPFGKGLISLTLEGFRLQLNMYPGVNDSTFYLTGNLVGNSYTGTWLHAELVDFVRGPFIAEKEPPIPDSRGIYQLERQTFPSR